MNKLLSQEQCYEIGLILTQCLNANVASSYLWEWWLGLGSLVMAHRIARYFHKNFKLSIFLHRKSWDPSCIWSSCSLSPCSIPFFWGPQYEPPYQGVLSGLCSMTRLARQMPALILGHATPPLHILYVFGSKNRVGCELCFPVASLVSSLKPPFVPKVG